MGFTIIPPAYPDKRPRVGAAEVGLRTQPVPRCRGRYFYTLLLGPQLLRDLRLGRDHPALIIWGNDADVGKLVVARATGLGPRWMVRVVQTGDGLIYLSKLPDWMRADRPVMLGALVHQYENERRRLVVTMPAAVCLL